MPDQQEKSYESQMFDLLSINSMPELVGILRGLISDLPESQKDFYEEEIDMWGSLGNKAVIINDIIDVLGEDADEIMSALMEMTADEGPGKNPDLPRYVDPTKIFPEVTEETERMHVRPEEEYMYEDFWEKEWEPGPEPIPFPDLDELLEKSAPNYLKKIFKHQILHGTPDGSSYGLKYMDRPFVMDMLAKYLQAADPAAYQKAVNDGVFSRSRTGFSKPALISRLVKNMDLETLAAYWNSIVNHKTLPLVNFEEAYARYGGGEMGQDITPRWVPLQPGEERPAPPIPRDKQEVLEELPEESPHGLQPLKKLEYALASFCE